MSTIAITIHGKYSHYKKVIVVKCVIKTVVIIVIKIEQGMKRGLTIGYLKCRAEINFEVVFEANGAIGTIATKWDPILF